MPDGPSHLSDAARALALVDQDPARADALAHAVLAAHPAPEARSMALRCVGRVLARQGSWRSALRSLDEAVRVAEADGLALRAAQARSSSVVVLAALGRFDDALDAAAGALEALDGADLGRLLAHRAVVLSRLDRTAEALAHYAEALRLLPPVEPADRARLLSNRGLLLTYRGQYAAARADLDECRALCREHGMHSIEGDVLHNAGYLALVTGDLVTALEEFDRAEAVREQTGTDTFEVVLDRADALLAAELADEALAAAATAVQLARAAGRQADLPEAELTLARAHLVADDPGAARESAARARTRLRRQGRDGWAAVAGELVVRARWEAGERSAALAADGRRCADELAARGWQSLSLRARLVVAQVLLARGGATGAAGAADQLRLAASARRRGTADLRAAAWHAEALLRIALGNRTGALRALSAGLDIVGSHSAALGATDLRTQSMARGRPLAELGLELVMDGGRPRDVLRWAERVRTTALHHRPARPPRDGELAADLADLRRVTTAIAVDRAAGRDTTGRRREQLRLERAIRDRSRHARGAASHGAEGQRDRVAPGRDGRLDVTALADALGQRALVEYLWTGRALHAVVLVDGRCRVVRLGSYDQVLHEAESLRFAMHRLARRHGTEASLEVARSTRDHAAGALDAALLGPLRRLLDTRELVVVPTMQLHALPWPTLPSLHLRPMSVAPSAAVWLRAARAPSRTGPVALVAGPELVFAQEEVDELVAGYPAATRLVGADASAERVLAAMDGARVAHVACHGHFRTDNPQFSSLQLADGPLMVYDLERLARAPELVVLSACDTALSAVHPGDELVGLSSALFALGTRTLVASVSPVDDQAAKTLAVALHTRLLAGRAPAVALAEAQAAVGVPGFACYGVG